MSKNDWIKSHNIFLFLTLKYSCAISYLLGNRKDTSAWKKYSQKKREININYTPIDFFPSKYILNN